MPHSGGAVPPPRDDLLVLHARQLPVGYYRFLYDAVGREWNWTSRRLLSDAELEKIIRDPRDEIHVLYVAGVPAGFAELDRRTGNDIELKQFGLTRDYIGQGLGKFFLQWTIDKAWSYAPARLWLHTCTEDHPAALPNYLQAEFSVYHQETDERP